MTQPNQELLNFITALRVALPPHYEAPDLFGGQPLTYHEAISVGFNGALDKFTQIIDQLSKEYGIPESYRKI